MWDSPSASRIYSHLTKMDLKQVLSNVLAFFERERDQGSKIGLHKPVERLAMASGLDRHQLYYILNRQGTVKPITEKVSEFTHFITHIIVQHQNTFKICQNICACGWLNIGSINYGVWQCGWVYIIKIGTSLDYGGWVDSHAERRVMAVWLWTPVKQNRDSLMLTWSHNIVLR